ncbi:serine/threonine-protein kinase [Streptomyces chromofuscus]|uniref:non-specific serine/threonine protein kinase n=1 Tax=Streptomyces chromofuscus TaxID=42881 RepID=A0A7M2T2F8_STRCW|nr:serine/threonine-protein kinase [Streptomyces chromofuscus]QOV41888.1 protein kinase [Streptomyces chromofuscus]GGS87494.1 serine/threonine protein kinase [Streptomyces chromofuscus]
MGEVFAGRYELADPIGRGGVGAVWRAWDHRRRRYVAAKVLQQRDAHSLLRFVREQALRIDHPHVLAPASWAADDDKVLFTMDLVAGGSLVHLVGDYGPLPPPFVSTLLDQLLSGLAAVHAEDVVHRDIKPANVLLEATGTGRPRLRLSDFGIAMRLGEPRLTETNLVVGTPGYLAPEQMMGAEPDFPADLFAVGLVALYLLEGAKPDAKAIVQYFADHGTPGAPEGIPEPLWQVVATLLQPDPVARFRTATGARKALAAAVELLPEPGPDDEQIEIFDQLGPLPPGFGPDGPRPRPGGTRPAGRSTEATGDGGVGEASGTSQAGHDGTPETPQTGRDAEPPQAPQTGRDAEPSGAPQVGRHSGTYGAPRVESGGIPVASSSRPGTASAATGTAGPDVSADPRHRQAAPPPQPANMSDTGSFHLPPPQPTVTTRRPPTAPPSSHGSTPRPQHSPPPHYPPQAQPPLHPAPAPAQPGIPHRPDVSTASYTAQDPQVPPLPRPPTGHRRTSGRSSHRTSPRGGRRASRHPGPPAKAVVPLLLLALVCYAVGFWALTRI